MMIQVDVGGGAEYYRYRSEYSRLFTAGPKEMAKLKYGKYFCIELKPNDERPFFNVSSGAKLRHE
jgi:hypothetical protein